MFESFKPEDIEKRSFEIIENELIVDLKDNKDVVKRVIHTTADFDYADNLVFSEDAVNIGRNAIKKGASIITDTKMAMAGINKQKLEKYNTRVYNFIADDDVIAEAKNREITRSYVAMEKGSKLDGNLIFVVGNAPTALISIYNMVRKGGLKPALIIAVPVGFVNVVESKELIMELNVPYIVAKGRKGGSNVAAAVVNALTYGIKEK